ncbi:hypothetical protein AKJ18_33285 [Vibrio xuii]|nr:hypothetical protein AKJ18_33285 [Vibrio xuii]
MANVPVRGSTAPILIVLFSGEQLVVNIAMKDTTHDKMTFLLSIMFSTVLAFVSYNVSVGNIFYEKVEIPNKNKH